ncbi:UNKNOWN [Stylonychia lemnae]|uniref:Uncharacterized protein n=1 Tax=Stylonychia lemnae TaxID=5949 RepID=A0A078AL87_STYLE|nr:UNKNOWN [Stylonychia lemnae]|eukprot:CDW82641.1 UNKNOWN [Stylonychia lemnae]
MSNKKEIESLMFDKNYREITMRKKYIYQTIPCLIASTIKIKQVLAQEKLVTRIVFVLIDTNVDYTIIIDGKFRRMKDIDIEIIAKKKDQVHSKEHSDFIAVMRQFQIPFASIVMRRDTTSYISSKVTLSEKKQT